MLRKTRICSDFAQKIWPKYCSLRPLLAMYVNVSYSKLHHNMSLYLITYIMIIAPNIRSHATLLCGVPADAELLRPAMPVLVQNSWVNQKYFMLSNLIRSVPSKSITRHWLFPEGPCWVTISKAVLVFDVRQCPLSAQLISHDGNLSISRQSLVSGIGNVGM